MKVVINPDPKPKSFEFYTGHVYRHKSGRVCVYRHSGMGYDVVTTSKVQMGDTTDWTYYPDAELVLNP